MMRVEVLGDAENGRVIAILRDERSTWSIPMPIQQAAAMGLALLCKAHPDKAGQLRAILPDVPFA